MHEHPNDDRRATRQPAGRRLGQVISCTGSSALITAPIETGAGSDTTWSIGNLVTITTPASRVVGFVRSVETANRTWLPEGPNELLANIDLVGEITEAGGRPAFHRGIRTYPYLGTIAHRIRHSDLEAIYRVDAGQGTEIGRLTQDETIPATIDIDSMLKRHFAIVGTTGVGKSTSVTIVVRKAAEVRPNLRVIMLDPHNEFAAAFGSQARILDAKSFDLPFWLLRFDEFAEVVFRGRDVSDHEYDFLREAVEHAKGAFAADSRSGLHGASVLRRSFREQTDVITADRPVPFRLTDIYAQIEEEIGKLESRYPRHDLKMLRARLKEVADDPNFAFMFGKASVEDTTEMVLGKLFNLPDASRRVTILQMGGIPAESVNAVVSVLARLSFDMAMLSSGQIETLIVCEEAHRYVPNDSKLGFGPTRRALARIAKEGRKYGAYLAIVTQRPGELDPTILSQCSTVFSMRLTNEFDQEIIRSAIADSSTGILAFLSSLGNREAIAFGEGIATPMRMKFMEIVETQRPSPSWLEKRNAFRGVDLREIVSRLRGNDPTTPATPPDLHDALPQPMEPPAHFAQAGERMAPLGGMAQRAHPAAGATPPAPGPTLSRGLGGGFRFR